MMMTATESTGTVQGGTGSYMRLREGMVDVLCFDSWSDGTKEAWIVPLTPADFARHVESTRSGEKDCITQDLIADYDSEFFDFGTVGYIRLAEESQRDPWIPLTRFECASGGGSA